MIKDPFGNFVLEQKEFLVKTQEMTEFQVKMNEINLYANDLCMRAFSSLYARDWPNRHTGKYEGQQFRAKVLVMKASLDEITEEEKEELRDFIRVHEYCVKVYEKQTEIFEQLRHNPRNFDIKAVLTMDWPKWKPIR